MLLLVVLSFSLFFSVMTCPNNCFCESYKAECHLTKCSDQLFTEVNTLIIYESLCENHKYILTHIDVGTQIVLKQDLCGDIPNFR